MPRSVHGKNSEDRFCERLSFDFNFVKFKGYVKVDNNLFVKEINRMQKVL